MTFADWVADTKVRFAQEPPPKAARESAQAFVRGGLRRLGNHIGRPIWQRGDWDVLVVLDACRVDQMKTAALLYDDLPDSVPSVWSNASCSIDWINRNFNEHPDEASRTGYVTANPFADHNSASCRSADLANADLPLFLPLYRTHWTELEGGIATVPPEPVTDHAIDAWRQRDRFGFDRLVIHYMQPHEPYITRPEWGSGDHKLLENLVEDDDETQAGASIWPRVKDGEIPVKELRVACMDNLRWVLDDVTGRLLENLDADVVLTSDHGNALGEWGEWHHPPGAIGPAVRRVPWLTVDGVDRGTVTPDVSLEAGAEPDDVQERLEALGYV